MQEDANLNGIGDACEGIDQGVGLQSVVVAPQTFNRFVGDKRYELSNHLGNVLSVVSDRKLFQNSLGFTTFAPDVLSYSDYYPFGSLVPNRHGSSSSYRYGFQGQEKDDEIRGGEGNSLNYTFRMHDPRVGRFFAVDPLEKKYPFYSSYAFSGNRVIDSGELEGLEPEDIVSKQGKLSNAMIGLLNGAFLFDKIKMQNTVWISSKDPNITTFQKLVYNAQKPDAISFYGVVVFNDKFKKVDSKKYWIGFVAHEQNHHNDMNKQGNTGFAVQYFADGSHIIYEKIPTEIESYKIEDEYMPLLLKYKNGAVLDLFDPQKNSYTDNQKAPILERLGAEFRINVILQNEINKNNKEIKSYESIISDLKNSKSGDNKMKILDYQGDINGLKKRNRQLKQEQSETKTKYNL